ncbi:LemA family protein [Pseudomonas sp. BMS12]|uniref:LemA family protein n=1 Tax=Pseudomonas sp. BMS12 TaxID=1796033 RepID=UPI000839E29B|nr:LemA family protein [Pseudomonas sp. BMS12]
MQGLSGWIALALVAAVLLAIIYGYNRLVFNRARVAEAWSGIDVQLKRRSSLIPQLVACLKAYMAHERETLEELVSRRGAAQAHERDGAADRAAVETQLTAALLRTFALVENYPQLKADAAFLDLQRNLSEVEEHIQMARRYYNGAVRELNVLVESFPSNLLARAFAFRCATYFTLDDARDGLSPKLEF